MRLLCNLNNVIRKELSIKYNSMEVWPKDQKTKAKLIMKTMKIKAIMSSKANNLAVRNNLSILTCFEWISVKK